MELKMRECATFLFLRASKCLEAVDTKCHKRIPQMNRFFKAFPIVIGLAIGLVACTSTPPMPSQQGTPGPQSPMPPSQSQSRSPQSPMPPGSQSGQQGEEQTAGGPQMPPGSQSGQQGEEQTAGGQTGSWPEGTQAGAGQQGRGGDDEFDRSLEDFDRIMGSEQASMARAGIGTAADEILGQTAEVGGSPDVPVGQSRGGDSSNSRENQSFRADETMDEETTLLVEGCEDDDTVARQLCEAATEEEDPFLRAALWEEYNEYNKILARQ